MERGKYQRKRKHRGLYLWVLALLLAGAAVWGVSAKYIQQREQELLVEAQMFYFTSDLLREKPVEYHLNPDTTSVTIFLRNYIDELRFSECDIQYTVSVNGNPENPQLLEGGKASSREFTFPVQAGGTYEVTVSGVAGYQKTLSATFIVEEAPTGFFMHLNPDESGRHYVLLTVWTENVSGDVTVSFPAGLIPDTTDPDLAAIFNYSGSGYTLGTTGSVNFGTYSSKTYRFFKEDPTRVYSLAEFTVMMGSTKATPGTP